MADQDRFVRAVSTLARALGRIGRERARENEITPQQAETLQLIAEKGSISTSALATTLGIDPSTASRNLAGLEQEGLISRKKGSEDGRQTEIRLTPRGKRSADHATTGVSRAFTTALEHLPRAERQKVTESLEALVRAFERNG